MFLESSYYLLSDAEVLRPSLTVPTYTEINTGKYNFLFLHFGSGSVKATPSSDGLMLVPDALLSSVAATPSSTYGVLSIDTDLPSVGSVAYSIYGIESIASTPSPLIFNVDSIPSILVLDPTLDSGLTFADSSRI